MQSARQRARTRDEARPRPAAAASTTAAHRPAAALVSRTVPNRACRGGEARCAQRRCRRASPRDRRRLQRRRSAASSPGLPDAERARGRGSLAEVGELDARRAPRCAADRRARCRPGSELQLDQERAPSPSHPEVDPAVGPAPERRVRGVGRASSTRASSQVAEPRRHEELLAARRCTSPRRCGTRPWRTTSSAPSARPVEDADGHLAAGHVLLDQRPRRRSGRRAPSRAPSAAGVAHDRHPDARALAVRLHDHRAAAPGASAARRARRVRSSASSAASADAAASASTVFAIVLSIASALVEHAGAGVRDAHHLEQALDAPSSP